MQSNVRYSLFSGESFAFKWTVKKNYQTLDFFNILRFSLSQAIVQHSSPRYENLVLILPDSYDYNKINKCVVKLI